MARSVPVVVAVAPLLLLSVLVSTAAAARAVAGDPVQDACSKTQFPKVCVDSLATKPESQKATPRKLAELIVNIAAEKGSKMATFVQGKYNNAKDNALFKCYDSCSDDIEEAVAHLNGLVREPTDAKFLELKSWLSSTLGGTSTCEDACKDAPKTFDMEEVVTFSLDFEKLQRVTLDLITEASGSMSAGIALPPSDAGAPSDGGAPSAAPSGGSADAPAGGSGSGSEGPAASSSSGSEGPAASAASGPSSGGDAKADGGSAASGPAAAASGPSSGGDAKADGGSAANGPASADAPAGADAPAAAASSSGGSSGAPAPSSSDSASAPGPSTDKSSSAGAPASSPGDGGDSGDDDDDDDTDDGSA